MWIKLPKFQNDGSGIEPPSPWLSPAFYRATTAPYVCDTHFQSITDNIYICFMKTFFYPSSDISTRPKYVLPVKMPGGQVST